MRLVLLAPLLAGCFIKPDAPEGTDDGGVIAGGTRREITITRPALGPLEKFPVALSFTEPDLGASAATVANIAFATIDGTALPCEILRFSPGVGTLEAWVQLPLVAGPTTTFLVIYGPDVQSTCVADQVWGEYHAVWHFSDSVPGSSADSSAGKHTLQTVNGLPLGSTVGAVGNGLQFDESNSDGGDSTCIMDTQALEFGDGEFTIEMWVRPQQLLSQYDIYLQNGAYDSSTPGYDIEIGSSGWIVWLRDDNSQYVGGVFREYASANVGIDDWNHLVTVADRKRSQLVSYVNGVEAHREDLSLQRLDNMEPFCLGDDQFPPRGFIDEVRLHSVAREAAWVRMAYENVKIPAFLSVGARR